MIRLELLGAPSLTRADGSTDRSLVEQPKRFALLALLASPPAGAAHRRDRLLGLFWPEMDEERARKALRQSLYALRGTLGRGVIRGGKEVVRIDPEGLRCDAAEFVLALEKGRDEDALALYGGPLLDGFHLSGAPEFERWVETERQRLAREAILAAWRLSARAAETGADADARRWGQRAVDLAPYEEEGFRRYLELLARHGDRASALRAYASFAERLAAELGVEPSAETHRLAEAIRSGEAMVGRAPRRVPPVASAADDAPAASASAGREAPAAVPPSSGRRNRRLLRRMPSRMAALIALVLGVGGVGWWAATPAGAPPLDPELIAVLPFRIQGAAPSLGYLREGLMDLVAAGLTGQDGIPAAVPPRVMGIALRNELGSPDADPDPAAARTLARTRGAGLLLSGTIIGREGSVAVRAVLRESESGQEVQRIEVDAPEDSLQRLAGSIIAQLAGSRAGIRPDRLSSLTTSSRTALLAYLEGEHALRRGWHADAIRAFDRAVSLDSTFALAALSLRRTQGWTNIAAVNGTRSLRLARRGYDSFGLVDRLYLDGLQDLLAGDEWLAHRRNAVRLAPESPELRFQLGDFYFHWGSALDLTTAHALARAEFEAALAADSTYLEPLAHLHDLAVARGDFAAARRHGDWILAVDSGSLLVHEARARHPQIAGPRPAVAYDSLPTWFLAELAMGPLLDVVPRHAAALEALERRLASRPVDDERRSVVRALLRTAVLEGRPRLVERLLAELPPRSAWRRAEDRMIFGFLWEADPAASEAAADTLGLILAEAGPSGASLLDPDRTVGACLYALRLSALGDANAARAETQRMSRGLEGVQPDTLEIRQLAAFNNARLCGDLVRADVAVRTEGPQARGLLDKVDRELARWPAIATFTIAIWNLHVARLWEAADDPARALVTARRWSRDDQGNRFRVDALLIEARAADRLGLREDAIHAYGRYLDWRPRAEPPFSLGLAGVRARLAELKSLEMGGAPPG